MYNFLFARSCRRAADWRIRLSCLFNKTSFDFGMFKVIPQYCIAHPYCASFFASLARANVRVHEHNERNLPQAKLDSEINVFFFLLNEHGDL